MDYLQDSNINGITGKGVQDRLLDSAERLFCEHGFYHTSVREIAAAANCNIASVNYYFGGKEKLYIEVWRYHLLIMRERIMTSIERVMSEDAKETYLEDLLMSFAMAFLEPIKDKRKAYQLIKLMDREMVEQNLPKNMFLEEMIMPTFNAMQNALMKIYPGLDKSKIHLFLFSIIGQLVHLIRVQTLYDQSYPLQFPGFDLNEAVNHIVKFSTAGIRAYTEGKIA
ncbi:MAG: TetR/AcrR family transcriptional regulator [Sedimentisphaerales bacterium]|nr:TetR/AcrR family transcriptional regulator [Sedimentisphaerales bacterium]